MNAGLLKASYVGGIVYVAEGKLCWSPSSSEGRQ